uniref:CRIM domain-containing protein n=1 Tax=Trichobilharzia regenti TaxID=157069 RepID=A0AA85JI08_TRIRE|nr:unnamed protein product [Trichobilharzia regenti]
MVSTDSKAYILNYLLNVVESATDEEIHCILSGKYSSKVIDTESENFYRYSPECPFVPCEDPLLLLNVSADDCENSTDTLKSSRKGNQPETRELSAEEIDKYFPAKPIVRTNKPSEPFKSALTLALEQAKLSGQLKRNKIFSDFAVYDARSVLSKNQRASEDCLFNVYPDSPLRQFNVWLWRLNGFPRTLIKVQPRLGTTVQQFIGLTLWQYINELSTSGSDNTHLSSRLDQLDESFLDQLALYMFDTSDDDEDVDSEFPPLELNDPIHKYQFESFALVERVETSLHEQLKAEVTSVLVTIHMAQGMSVLRFPSDTLLSAVLERAVYRRRLRQHGGYAYRLELWPRNTDQQTNGSKVAGGNTFLSNITNTQFKNKNSQLDLNQRLSYFISAGLPLHFLLVRESSRCDPALSEHGGDIETIEQIDSAPMLDTSEPVHTALQLRQYQVTYLKGLFPREVQLNISLNEVKLEQGSTSKTRRKLFSKIMKPISIEINAIADCELISSGFSTGSGVDSKSGCGNDDSKTISMSSSSSGLTVGGGGGGALTDNITSTDASVSSVKSSNKNVNEQSSKSMISRKAQFRIVYIPNFKSHSDLIMSQLTSTTSSASGQKSAVSVATAAAVATTTTTAATTTVTSRSTVNHQPVINPTTSSFSSPAYTATIPSGQDLPVCTSSNNNTSGTGVSANIPTTAITTIPSNAVISNSSSINNNSSSSNNNLFQQLCFETQWARARAICDQLNIILEVSQSQARQFYIQRKLNT